MLLRYFSRAHGADTGIERRCAGGRARRAVEWAVKAVGRSTVLIRHSLAVRTERAAGWWESTAVVLAGRAGESQAVAVNVPVATEDVLV